MDLDLYRAFLITAQRGSITAAAAELGLSRPTLSRHLAELEQRLGLALLHRSTRAVNPTPAGRRLAEQLAPLFADLSRVEAGLRAERQEVTGLLRVSVPPVLAPDLSRLLVQLQQQHPALSVELHADIGWAELRGDGVEVAVRAGRIKDPGLIQRRLGASEVGAVASPAYLARAGLPAALADLDAHQLLLGHRPEGGPQRWWPLQDGGAFPVKSSFSCNDQQALLEAALAHGGIALVSEVSSGPALLDGRLHRVLPALIGTRLQLHAVYARRTLQPARVTTFVEALVRWFDAKEETFGV